MSVESIIKEQVSEIANKTHIAPEIDDSKLNKAVEAIANGIDPDTIVAIADTTLRGNAGEGIVFTGDTLYIKKAFSDPIAVLYENIFKAEYRCYETRTKMDKVKTIEEVVLYDNDENELIQIDTPSIHKNELADMLNEILSEGDIQGSYMTSQQKLSLEDMPPEVKKTYVKVVCNYAYADDEVITPDEYSELTKLIARSEVQTETRVDLRAYMINANSVESTDKLITYLKENVDESTYPDLCKALMKEVLYIHHKKEDAENWQQDTFILDKGGIHLTQVALHVVLSVNYLSIWQRRGMGGLLDSTNLMSILAAGGLPPAPKTEDRSTLDPLVGGP